MTSRGLPRDSRNTSIAFARSILRLPTNRQGFRESILTSSCNQPLPTHSKNIPLPQFQNYLQLFISSPGSYGLPELNRHL